MIEIKQLKGQKKYQEVTRLMNKHIQKMSENIKEEEIWFLEHENVFTAGSSTPKEFKINETTAALNGGEDYEILFTINQSDYDLVEKSEIATIIGHVTKIEDGNKLITGLEQAIDLTAQGWSKI